MELITSQSSLTHCYNSLFSLTNNKITPSTLTNNKITPSPLINNKNTLDEITKKTHNHNHGYIDKVDKEDNL